MSDCKICKKPDHEKPMCFRGEKHCSEEHRKMIAGEMPRKKNENSVVE